jgi:ribonuclease P protein component
MLKRKFRIPRGIRFNNSRLFSSPLFTIKVRDNGFLFNRFAIVVSKKVDKRAVVRNRIRRLISSSIEELYNDLKQGKDTMFIVKREAINKSRRDFFKEIKLTLEKV